MCTRIRHCFLVGPRAKGCSKKEFPVPIQKIRRSVGGGLFLLYLLLPFLEIDGESAFRFDVPTLKLHFFGTSLWMQEFYFVMLGTLFVVLLFLFMTLVFGRVWCGWLCPQTVYMDLTSFLDRHTGEKVGTKIFEHCILIILSAVLGFITVCYFVSPYEAIPQAIAVQLGPVATGSTIVIAILLYLDLAFLRRTFCATICPYAKLQGAMTDSRSLIITMDKKREDECIHCRKCCKVCPTGVDIRKGMQVSCIMCAACIDACSEVMKPSGQKGLIRYKFGAIASPSLRNLARPAPIILGFLALFLGAVFLYQVSFRLPFDFAVLPHTMEARFTKDGGIINAYVLSVKNMEKREIDLEFILDPAAVAAGFSHSINGPLNVPAGLVEKFPLFIRATDASQVNRKMAVMLRENSGEGRLVRKSLYFASP